MGFPQAREPAGQKYFCDKAARMDLIFERRIAPEPAEMR
jgi:hypothetical protein